MKDAATRKRLAVALGMAGLLPLGIVGAALATGGTTGTVSVCATARGTTVPAHTINDGTSPLGTIPAVTVPAATKCATTTYTIPTVTTTVTRTTTTTPKTSTTTTTTTTPTTTPTTIPAPPPPTALNGLKVSGNHFVDNSGNAVHLHGVNRSGTEYACIQGWGVFDGPSDDASIKAMKAWNINIVRVPINEDCWLNINMGSSTFGGAVYQTAIETYVKLLHANGMYAELSLIWGAPGSARAAYQPNAPDADHSPALWSSLAAAFAGDQNLILAPWGEPTVGWSCFLNGCNDQSTYGSNQDGLGPCSPGSTTCYFVKSAGMQQAVNLMRTAGFHGPIASPCIAYANVCADPSNGGTGWGNGKWLANHPTDPDHQLVAEAHVYGKNTCDTTACFDLTMKPILDAGYPLIFGETGETYDASSCSSTNTQSFLDWADAHNVGYESWTWDTWGNCSALISNYNGTPANAYGTFVQQHDKALP